MLLTKEKFNLIRDREIERRLEERRLRLIKEEQDRAKIQYYRTEHD